LNGEEFEGKKESRNIQLSAQDITHETASKLLKSITELNCTCNMHTCPNCITHIVVIITTSIMTWILNTVNQYLPLNIVYHKSTVFRKIDSLLNRLRVKRLSLKWCVCVCVCVCVCECVCLSVFLCMKTHFTVEKILRSSTLSAVSGSRLDLAGRVF